MYVIFFSEIPRPFQNPKSTSGLVNRAVTHIGKPTVEILSLLPTMFF